MSLSEINERNVQHFFFDGVLCYEGKKRYLQKVPFDFVSIGGYEDLEASSVGGNVWLQSFKARRIDVWYRLGLPAPEYRRYQSNFLWRADLAKHVVDFLYTNDRVHLSDFKSHFQNWLKKFYPNDVKVSHWLKEFGHSDFRIVVTGQANFLYCQAIQVNPSYQNHPLWCEIDPQNLNAVPKQIEESTDLERFTSSKEGQTPVLRRKTTVTPYVFNCFQQLPWVKFLYPQLPLDRRRYTERISSFQAQAANNLVTENYRTSQPSSTDQTLGRFHISVGDVIAVPSDVAGSWKNQGSEWYALVQAASNTSRGLKLELLWLYKPSDTACLKMDYPHENELFLSDHCNCGDPAIYADEVVGKPNVKFFGQPDNNNMNFFCRQRYSESEAAWVTLKPSHFRCACKAPNAQVKYSPGETVLYAKRGSGAKDWLEPAIVVSHMPQTDVMTIRRLLRKGRDLHGRGAAPNELVYTELIENVRSKQIRRKCHVRFYSPHERDNKKIPTPYDRQGMVDCYYICDRQLSESAWEPICQPWPSDVKQGWDPLRDPWHQPLKGLDIFCGGGNFGRGLEEGGAVEFEYAVDYANEAIHTYKANLRLGSSVKLFRGSVNQYLSDALQANRSNGMVAQLGDIDFIAAGSPCQGFSFANPFKGTDDSLLNESMVGSVTSFIDFYRPKYALLENVKGMASGGEDRNALAAVTCCLVGMGYQIRTLALDAWSFGSPQSRSRIFISACAPGLAPLPEPPHTHTHPEDIMGGSLGKTANGLQTGARYIETTPFDYISALEATRDLPSNDAYIGSISYPDHRLSRPMSVLNRNLISSVPRYPGGHGFLSSYNLGLMPHAQIKAYSWHNHLRAGKNSKSFSRIRRNRLIPTIMTDVKPEDGVTGTSIHWDDHRTLTILEARRAQGFPDHEVIVGSTAAQYRIIGNSVARPVALALGTSLRAACIANEVTTISQSNL